MWYSELYRRHLLDMHIDDWDDSFLGEFSPEEYVENLKRAHINMAMIYLQSHAGLCYYPTKTGVMHKAFVGREDAMKRLVDMCHEAGIRVVGYYSLIYNTREHDRRPEWHLVNAEGRSRRVRGDNGGVAQTFASTKLARYGLCCPNNMEYRQFVFDQIDEMMEYFDCDGLFFDMPFWPETCYCEHCRQRWDEEVGGAMPTNLSPLSEHFVPLSRKRNQWMGEFVKAVAAHVKSRDADMAVEFNYASVFNGTQNGCAEPVNEASDYAGGDLYGGSVSQSLTCKFYYGATRNQPFEYMFSRCKPALRSHTLTKSLDQMKTAMAITMSHHGATLVIDAIDPVGTMDRRVYDRVAEAFSMEEPYEPYFRGKLVEDVAIYFGVGSRHDSVNEPRNGDTYTSVSCSASLADTLIRNHIAHGVTGSYRSLSGYSAIFAPVLSELEEGDNDRLIQYVRDGGTLYLSGAGNRKLVEELTGGRVTGYTMENKLYIAPRARYEKTFGGFNAKYPLPFDGFAPVLEGVDRRHVVATLTLPYTDPRKTQYASIHSDPPGRATDIPAVIVRGYGAGKVIWSALPMEDIKMDDYRDIVLRLVLGAKPRKSVKSDAPANVELTLFRDEEGMTLNAVVLCDEVKSTAAPSFRVKVAAERTPHAVKLLPEGRAVPFTYRDGYVSFRTRTLRIFDMYRIEF